MSFTFTTENVLNDLSRVSVVSSVTPLAAPTGVTPTGSTTGGTLAAGTYYYVVTATTGDGSIESIASSEVNVTTTGTTGSVSIAWTASSGATGYKIYRGTATGAENVYFTDTASPFVDTGATGTAGTPPTTTNSGVTDPGIPVGQTALVIKRLNKFLSGNTTAVYKRVGTAPVLEVNTITIPAGATAAGVYRLDIDVRMSGSYPIDYDRWAINKGKPFYFEVNMLAQASASAFATAFVAGVQNALIKENGTIIKDIVVTASGANVVITASNEYQRIIYAAVTTPTVDPLDSFSYEFLPYTVGSLTAVGVTTTAGAEGFGTSWYLTKNVRIPTNEAIRFYGTDQDERPVIGVTYNQYVLKYNALRNIGSDSYVGGLGTTYTDHVLWVPSTLASTFEGYITSAFGSIITNVLNVA